MPFSKHEHTIALTSCDHGRLRPDRLSAARLRLALLLAGVGLLGPLGCAAPASSTPDTSSAGTTEQPRSRSIAETLKADARFTDFVDVINLAGLGDALDDLRDMTVFAPTNAAFDRSDPGWRTRATPNTSTRGGGSALKRQALIEQSELAGVHPPAEFVGKLQDVRSLDGRIFHIDGRTPGVITITTGPIPKRGMGFSRQALRTARAELPPIEAKNGLIYPVDTILVR